MIASASTATLRAELRAFVRARGVPLRAAERVTFPPHLSEDAGAVVSGRKTLLDVDSKFRFACSGCGACCRSYAETVLVDAADVFLLPKAARPAARPAAFRATTGLFRLAALPPSVREEAAALEGTAGDVLPPHLRSLSAHGPALDPGLTRSLCEEEWDDESSTTHDGSKDIGLLGGLSRILYLRSIPADSGESAAAASRHRRPRSRRQRVAPTAAGVSGVSHVGGAEKFITIASDSHRACVFSEPGVRVTPAHASHAGPHAGLRCSLGSAMPYTCSLYPLGDLTSTKARPPALFFSLDARACEGVAPARSATAAAAAASPRLLDAQSVAAYREAPARALDVRWHRAVWAHTLSTVVAAVQLDQRLAAALASAQAAACDLAAERRRRGLPQESLIVPPQNLAWPPPMPADVAADARALVVGAFSRAAACNRQLRTRLRRLAPDAAAALALEALAEASLYNDAPAQTSWLSWRAAVESRTRAATWALHSAAVSLQAAAAAAASEAAGLRRGAACHRAPAGRPRRDGATAVARGRKAARDLASRLLLLRDS